MAFRYSRPAMTGAAIFTLAGVTVLPLAQANAAPASPQDEARSGATQGQPNSAAQNGQDQGQQQGANANGQGQRQQAQPGATQGQQGANASGQNQDGATQGGATQDPSQAASGGEQQQGAPASQSSSNSKSASQNNQSRQSQPSAPAVVGITSVDGFIDPQKTDNSLTVETTGIDDIDRVEYDLRVQELDEFGNVVDDDVSTTVGGSSISSEGHFDLHVNVDGTKINPSHKYQVHLTAYDQGDMTTSEGSYPVVVWNHTHIPVFPLLAAQ